MFNEELQGTFVLFSTSHLVAATIVFFLTGLVIYFKDEIRESRYYNVLRIGLGAAILLQELSLNIYRIVRGEWMISTSLPLQLCGLGVLTTAIVLFTKSRKLFINTFFLMLIGAFMAILTPGIERNLGFPHFRFFQFFVSHGLIVINFTFILFVMNFQENIRYKHVYTNVLAGIMIASVLLVVNLITGGNYMYLMAKPGPNTAFDLFGEHPWYLLNIFLFGIPILFHLFYVPFFVRDDKRRQKALA